MVNSSFTIILNCTANWQREGWFDSQESTALVLFDHFRFSIVDVAPRWCASALVADELYCLDYLHSVLATDFEIGAAEDDSAYDYVRLPGGATDRLHLSSQVMNALRAEALDEKIADEAPRSSISVRLTRSPMATTTTSLPRVLARITLEKGSGSVAIADINRKAKIKITRQILVVVASLLKVAGIAANLNHILANCPTAKPKEGSQGQSQPTIPRKVSATAIGARPRKADITEWVLDTTTAVHACTDMNLLMDPQPDQQHLFLDFDGKPKRERLIGDVHILVNIEMANQKF
ncbi:hypothetical protein ON010_g14679 [Phytophthora cinnamomi]|nr:hypothetical protein ON010_g14679 [Phytophthora cinnamomi]